MTAHVYEKHANCKRMYCMVCEGGLAICSVCGCLEGSLAAECPGFNCWVSHGEAIYQGYIDYFNGAWHEGASHDGA